MSNLPVKEEETEKTALLKADHNKLKDSELKSEKNAKVQGGKSKPVKAEKNKRNTKVKPPKGTSIYKGVAQHRVTRRWESHVSEVDFNAFLLAVID